MIHLRFEGGASGPDVILGPAPWFRIAGNFIRQGPHGSIVGSFRNHYWEVQSKRLIRYFCEDPYQVHFEDAGGRGRSTYWSFRSTLDGGRGFSCE